MIKSAYKCIHSVLGQIKPSSLQGRLGPFGRSEKLLQVYKYCLEMSTGILLYAIPELYFSRTMSVHMFGFFRLNLIPRICHPFNKSWWGGGGVTLVCDLLVPLVGHSVRLNFGFM